MKSWSKVLIFDILKFICIFYAVVYFLLTLSSYYMEFLGKLLFYDRFLKYISFDPGFLKALFSDQKTGAVASYFVVGFLFLVLGFVVDAVEAKVYAGKEK